MSATLIPIRSDKRLTLKQLLDKEISKNIEADHCTREVWDYVVDQFRVLKSKKRVGMKLGLAARVVGDIVDFYNLPERKPAQSEVLRFPMRMAGGNVGQCP